MSNSLGMLSLVDKRDWYCNVKNSNIPLQIVKQLMNSNAQFIVDMSSNMGISYSITSLSIHLVNYFFYKNSYLENDRFVVCAGSILLASKVLDIHIQTRRLCSAYHTEYSKINKVDEESLLDERVFAKIKDKICEAESNLLKTIGYKLNFDNPYDHINQIYKNWFMDNSKSENKEIFFCSRIIM